MAGRKPKGRRALKGSHVKSKQRGNEQAAACSQAKKVPRTEVVKRRQLEEALLAAHTAIELAVEGISKLDDTGHYVFVNMQYAALLGYRPEELIGQSWEVTAIRRIGHLCWTPSLGCSQRGELRRKFGG